MPERRAGDVLIRVGAVLSVAGMALTLVALLPLVSDVELPSQWWALSMLVGIGMGLVLAGLAANGRRRARAQATALDRSE